MAIKLLRIEVVTSEGLENKWSSDRDFGIMILKTIETEVISLEWREKIQDTRGNPEVWMRDAEEFLHID